MLNVGDRILLGNNEQIVQKCLTFESFYGLYFDYQSKGGLF